MGSTVNKFEFGPIGNKVVAALVTGVALGGVLLSLWLVVRVVGLAHDVWRARDWPVVQASVLHVSISSAREPRRLGYYQTRIKYRYDFAGRQYQAGRLVFTETNTESADIWDGKWLSGVVAFMENSRREGRPVPVFVNPADPADAVVFRDMVWGNYVIDALLMLLSAVFPIGFARLVLRHRSGMATVQFAQFGIVLLYLVIALTGATVAAAV